MNEIKKTQYFTVTGILFPDNRLLLQPGYLTEESAYTIEDPESPLIAELVDEQNRVLLRFRLPVSAFCADGNLIAQRVVTGKIPFPANTQSVRFYLDDILIHELNVPKGKPVVQVEWIPPEPVVGRHTISWNADHPEGLKLYYMVSYSHTDGQSWQPLSLSTEEAQQEIDFDLLPGGERCRIGILATDGVNTVLGESQSFAVPVKPCRAMILAPEDVSSFAIGELVLFQGQGYYLEEQRAETENLEWTSSQDGELGRGMAIEVRGLSPGLHQITLRAGTRERTGEASISIGIGGETHQEWVLS